MQSTIRILVVYQWYQWLWEDNFHFKWLYQNKEELKPKRVYAVNKICSCSYQMSFSIKHAFWVIWWSSVKNISFAKLNSLQLLDQIMRFCNMLRVIEINKLIKLQNNHNLNLSLPAHTESIFEGLFFCWVNLTQNNHLTCLLADEKVKYYKSKVRNKWIIFIT